MSRTLKQAVPTESKIRRADEEAEDLRLSIYDDLLKSLVIQIHAAKVTAVRLKATDKEKAVLYLRKARQLEAQQEQLKRARDDPSKPEPPEFQRVKRVTRKEINFPDIPAKVVRVHVEAVQNLVPSGQSTFTTYLYCDFRFTESSAPITLTGPVVGGAASPAYKHDFDIPIERTKLYAKYFERKKIPICVYHKRPLLKDVQVAHFEVPLAPMLHKAEAAVECPVVLGAAKKPSTTCTATVTLRMRTPLLGRDIVETEEEDLVITSPIFGAPEQKTPAQQSQKAAAPQTPPEAAKKTVQQEAAKQKPKQKAEAPAPAVQQQQQQQQQQPKPAPATTSSTSPKVEGGGEGEVSQEEIEALRDECYDVKRYFSCELCEWEVARLQKELAALRAAKKPTEDVTDRINVIESQSQTLVILVQTGKLTMEGYLENLNKLLNNDKALFKKLLQAKMLPETKIVKARIAVLTAEIQSSNEE